MDDVDALTSVYDYVRQNMPSNANADDLLRSKIVCSVSAFDKLMHDIIHTGIVEAYAGNRATTPKYLDEPIPLKIVARLDNAGESPRDTVFARSIRDKLRTLSFQHPEKVADGLSYIWPENRKWQRIAAAMGEEEKGVREMLKSIVQRRNAIAHEADLRSDDDVKQPISREGAVEAARFMRQLGETFHRLIR
ncbi:hypothetical protein UC34_03475 [Pandoraea vervacti]|uniref:RiboL-PSP-HEPN domain-containing protein n=1 Tax=Pandoraea vervacti TaxID=656178 RepID=A0ABN4UB94_9BURK|nr:HEPN domain-containing protein [Pandoraea vervacti]APD11128.1 hypothetical protein UC34_03475 [Pandoraea vervacti]